MIAHAIAAKPPPDEVASADGPLCCTFCERDRLVYDLVCATCLDTLGGPLHTALYDLVRALPACQQCDQPATMARGPTHRWCDAHAPAGASEFPRAKATRAATALLRGASPATSR